MVVVLGLMFLYKVVWRVVIVIPAHALLLVVVVPLIVGVILCMVALLNVVVAL